MAKAYLTIDDSPTRHTDEMTDWLVANDIPAVLFCIGSSYTDLHLQCEGMEQNPAPIQRAIEKGFVIGNHTWTHRRSSELSYKEIISEIEKTERTIDAIYRAAKKPKTHKLLRFPHIDRGCGGWVVDYNAAGKYRDILKEMFVGGLNIKLTPPTEEQKEKKDLIQTYLKKEGYSAEAFKGVTFDWYQHTEMKDAADSLYTYSTSDWMINPDFKDYSKDWQYQSLDALKKKIDDDATLKDEKSAHIILAHDHNNLCTGTKGLIAHMKQNGIEFIGV